MNVRPLITICGTTGVGKSRLAIELALHLTRSTSESGWKGARIINADSMQVYSGMDIITNKVPESQQQGIEHLLMGFKAPGEQYVVGQWVQDALKVIKETHDRKEVPIVVGGTSYWIQHLIFPNRLSTTGDSTPSKPHNTSNLSPDLKTSITSLPPELLDLYEKLPIHPPSAATDPETAFNLHTLLSILDSRIAIRWHWRDTRKVLRSLRIIKESGRRASEMIAEQSASVVVNKPRFRTLCFWLYAEPHTLETRLNQRVDKMIEDGLLNEILSLRNMVDSIPPRDTDKPPIVSYDPSTDYTLGIYQSIGYKEFHEYLSSPEPSEKSFKKAVEHMKTSTRQYAKRQISWLRNKLLPSVYAANEEDQVVSMYLLDATELEDYWAGRVHDPAVQITQAFLARRILPDPFSLSHNAQKMLTIDPKPSDPASLLDARRKLVCPICTTDSNRPFMVEEGQEWQAHQKTRFHRRMAKKGDHDLSFQARHKDKPSC